MSHIPDLPAEPGDALTLDMIAAARWADDGSLVGSAAAGRPVLARVDTSDQWCYRATLCTGEQLDGWPLVPLRSRVRRVLRRHVARSEPR